MAKRPEKTEDGFTIIYSKDDLPVFENERQEHDFWSTHVWSEELMDEAATQEFPAPPSANGAPALHCGWTRIRWGDLGTSRVKRVKGIRRFLKSSWWSGFMRRRSAKGCWVKVTGERMNTLRLRLPDSLHKQVKALAKDEGMSMDQFATSAVAEKLAALMTEEYLAERAARGNREAFERVLAKVPDVEPDEEDRF